MEEIEYERIRQAAKKFGLKTRLASAIFIRSDVSLKEAENLALKQLEKYQKTGDVDQEFITVYEEWVKDGRP